MPFDAEKFTSASFTDRTEKVPVPRLAAFFGKKDKPEWTVRGLTGLESAVSNQAAADNKNLDAILTAISTKVTAEKVEGIRELAGLTGDSVPDELVKRYAWLRQGSVDPVCTHEMAMKLAENFPEDFYLLTNKILQLTGQGRLGE
jgi:hypothetical protein